MASVHFFSTSAKLVEILKGVSDRLDELAIPFADISKDWEQEIRGRFSSRGDGSWPILDPDTVERHGAHSLLIHKGHMLGSISRAVRKTYFVVFANRATAQLHDTYGRQAGHATGGGRRNRKSKTTAAQAQAKGLSVKSWGAMPIRSFMYITEQMEERAVDRVIAHFLGDVK